MTHVAWPTLLPLALRLHASRAALKHGPSIALLREDREARLVLGSLSKVSISKAPEADEDYPEVVVSGPDPAPLQSYFAAVGIEVTALNGYRSSRSQLAGELLESLGALCRERVCEDCQAKVENARGEPCQWQKSTKASNLRALGRRESKCLEPLRDVFDFCVSSSTSVYGALDCPIITLSTRAMFERNTACDLALNAETRDVSNGQGKRQVDLGLCASQFEIDDYLALPYVLLHECLVHGFCGVRVSSAEAELSKSFHEGWLDAVANIVLTRCLGELRSSDPSHNLSKVTDDVLRQTRRVRETRYNPSRSGRSVDVYDWLAGEQAFETLRWLLTIVHSDIPDAGRRDERVLDDVVDFSLKVNASALGHEQRGTLVADINRRFTRGDLGQRLSAFRTNGRAVAGLVNFVQSRDPAAFIDGLAAE